MWITGLPASGKSTVAAALASELRARSVAVEVLESDVLRRVFTPHPRYDEAERDAFYGQIAYLGAVLARHGMAVIFDATANRRAISRPGAATDPALPGSVRGYAAQGVHAPRSQGNLSRRGDAVPGLQAAYEPPLHPDLVIHGDQEAPDIAPRGESSPK